MLRATSGIIASQKLKYDPDAAVYFTAVAAAGVMLSSTEIDAYNTFVLSAKAHGYYSKMVLCYPMLGATSASNAINSITPGTYNAVFYNSPTHSANGVQFDGVSQYADTGLTDNVLPQDDTHISYYSRTQNADNNQLEAGTYGTGSGAYILYGVSSGMASGPGGDSNYTALNCLQVPHDPLSNTLGFASVSRSDSTTVTSFHQGVKVADYSQPSLAPLTANIFFGAIHYTVTDMAYGFSTKECAFMSKGYGISDTEAANFATDVQTFQTTLGRQV